MAVAGALIVTLLFVFLSNDDSKIEAGAQVTQQQDPVAPVAKQVNEQASNTPNLSGVSKAGLNVANGQDINQEDTALTDEQLVEFAVFHLELIDIGIRPDRYSLEELVLIAKYIKEISLTPEELEINFEFYLDVVMRRALENNTPLMNTLKGEEEWVAEHAYNGGFDYWENLAAQGDSLAPQFLADYYKQARYFDKAIGTYIRALKLAKSEKHKRLMAFSLSELLIEKDPLAAVAYYTISLRIMNSGLMSNELATLAKNYTSDEIQFKIDEIQSEWQEPISRGQRP